MDQAVTPKSPPAFSAKIKNHRNSLVAEPSYLGPIPPPRSYEVITEIHPTSSPTTTAKNTATGSKPSPMQSSTTSHPSSPPAKVKEQRTHPSASALNSLKSSPSAPSPNISTPTSPSTPRPKNLLETIPPTPCSIPPRGKSGRDTTSSRSCQKQPQKTQGLKPCVLHKINKLLTEITSGDGEQAVHQQVQEELWMKAQALQKQY